MLTPTPTRQPRSTRPTTDDAITIEGIVLLAPMERHTHSLWRVLETDHGVEVRFIVAFDSALTRWIEVGQRVRVTGLVRLKTWLDGTYPTVSAHDRLQILDMPSSWPR